MSVAEKIKYYRHLLKIVTKLVNPESIYSNKSENKNKYKIYLDDKAFKALDSNDIREIRIIVKYFSFTPIKIQFARSVYREAWYVNKKWISYNYLIHPIVLKLNAVACYKYDKQIFKSIFNSEEPIVKTKKQVHFVLKYYDLDDILFLFNSEVEACTYMLAKKKLDFETQNIEFINWFHSAAIIEEALINTNEIANIYSLNYS